jgi:hypothetical protein
VVLTVLIEPAVAQGALAMKRATAPEKQGRTMIGLFSRCPMAGLHGDRTSLTPQPLDGF